MRNLVIFAVVMIVAGTYMAQLADRMSAQPAQASPAPITVAAATAAAAAPAGRTVVIPRDRRGHFQTDGRIDGQRLSFMVDTGASIVALTETDAARIGLRPLRSDYTAMVTTANGKTKAARVHLASLDVGGLVVRDVDAIVLPDGVLSENLLGLSYLSKLKRFEYADGKMVLE